MSTPPPGLANLRVLAHGGYATVYRATQLSVGRDVALKIDNRTLDSEPDRRRFRFEARATGRVSGHPHVIDLFDAGVTAEGHPYLVMELCTGSYADLLRRRRCDPVEVATVGVRIADALAAAHGSGVLHRDVKPANILTTRFDSPVLADFGLAVLLDQADPGVGLDALTPAYAPPESFDLGFADPAGFPPAPPAAVTAPARAAGATVPVQSVASDVSGPTRAYRPPPDRPSSPTPAGDVYSLAATLYALLAGHPPRLSGVGSPTVATLLEKFEEPVPDVPGAPADLVDVLRTGMVNDPAARPTAAVLRDRLASTAPLARSGGALV